MNKANAFISYRRKPSAAVAQLLQEKLHNRYSLDIYVDTTRTDSSGVQFPERLLQAITDSSVFICLLSDSTLESEWVRKEIERAYQLGKRCIPVFQESYTPPESADLSIEYLLRFDGVHIFDEKSLFVDETVAQLAALIRPPRQRTLPALAAGLILGLAVIIFLVGLNSVMRMALGQIGTATDLVALSGSATDADANAHFLSTSTRQPMSPSATNTPTLRPTQTLTRTPRPSLTAPATPVPNETEREETVQAMMNSIQLEAIGTQTAVALSWTNTPTPNDRATAEARLTATLEQALAYQRATADVQRATPTVTSTPTRSADPLESVYLAAMQFGQEPHNAWTPIIHTFDGVNMVLVPPGCFMMGSQGPEPDERPVHQQCFDAPFWIDETEVTQAQFEQLGGVQIDPPDFNGANRPVDDVNWFEARDYCALRGGRLMTEAEWEYAARGPDALMYVWGNEWNADNAVWNRGRSQGTADVQTIPAGISWVGAYDIAGNVMEWTSSVYSDYPYNSGSERTNEPNAFRAVRGEAWNTTARSNMRLAYRSYNTPHFGSDAIGIRCARSWGS
jgi:formylglycine-generating enzyme